MLKLCPGCMAKHIPANEPEGRCLECRRKKQKAHDARRGTASQRGYGKKWRDLRAAAIAAQPWCSFCHHPGSRDNPLSADHVVEKARGGSDDPSNIRVFVLAVQPAAAARSSNPRRPAGKAESSQANRDDAPSVA
jgi:5-methylcytosine-specific restriction protein A